MHLRILLSSFLSLCSFISVTHAQVSLRYEQNQTLTYQEIIQAYTLLDDTYENAKLYEAGNTDSGKKLHVFLISDNKIEEGTRIEELLDKKVVVLINNGIHPGESCGIDASLLFSKDLLQRKSSADVVYAIIPVYNIGGCLNRGSYSRANQDGPEEHGFRGNARNLDLNRDFMKMDTRNTESFFRLFHTLKPHIFVDTHTSNGADYQYTMTLICTQKDKLNPVLSNLMTEQMEPFLYKNMKKQGWEMSPYVNVFGRTPNDGFAAFLETPRYASGYTTLFNTIGFITEAHMLKPYKDRVLSTYAFLQVLAKYCEANDAQIMDAKKEAEQYDHQLKSMAINWKLDSSQTEERTFKGYEYVYEPSQIAGQRLKYFSNKPDNIKLNYYPSYIATQEVEVPTYYVLPAAWYDVVERLQLNEVEMQALAHDTTIEVSSWYVLDYTFPNSPYEGHFFIKDLKVEKKVQVRQFYKGDYLIATQQKNKRFIVSALEPTAVDSYLRWNFFDEIFQQKEYFSPYVFEDTAEELLRNNSELRTAFEKWKMDNPQKAQVNYYALSFIYTHSAYYEKEHLRYPVARIE